MWLVAIASGHIFISNNKKKGTPMINWFDNYMRYMRTIAELNALSNRELADLGMTREEIIFEATKQWVKAS